MEIFTREVKEFAQQVGADMVGIAGKECFNRLPYIKPDKLLPDAQSVVVIITRTNPHIASYSYNGSWSGQENYAGDFALRMHILLRTSRFIEDRGFETLPVSGHGYFTSNTANIREAARYLTVTQDGELQGIKEFEKAYWGQMKILPHMHLAEEAGLGEIGRCKQLLTPQFGPRVGIVSVITDAPLVPDKKLEEPICKKDECNKCVEACRSGALKPDGYNVAKCMIQMWALPPIDIIRRKDQEAMDRYFHAMDSLVFPFERRLFGKPKSSGESDAGGCGMCVIACPVGRRHSARPLHTKGKASISLEIL